MLHIITHDPELMRIHLKGACGNIIDSIAGTDILDMNMSGEHEMDVGVSENLLYLLVIVQCEKLGGELAVIDQIMMHDGDHLGSFLPGQSGLGADPFESGPGNLSVCLGKPYLQVPIIFARVQHEQP
ncbi:hypothetical protein D3C71_1451400 [compost metagenome]